MLITDNMKKIEEKLNRWVEEKFSYFKNFRAKRKVLVCF